MCFAADGDGRRERAAELRGGARACNMQQHRTDPPGSPGAGVAVPIAVPIAAHWRHQEGWHFSRDDYGLACPLSVERLKMDLPYANSV